jgi:hypothetical protein
MKEIPDIVFLTRTNTSAANVTTTSGVVLPGINLHLWAELPDGTPVQFPPIWMTEEVLAALILGLQSRLQSPAGGPQESSPAPSTGPMN